MCKLKIYKIAEYILRNRFKDKRLHLVSSSFSNGKQPPKSKGQSKIIQIEIALPSSVALAAVNFNRKAAFNAVIRACDNILGDVADWYSDHYIFLKIIHALPESVVILIVIDQDASESKITYFKKFGEKFLIYLYQELTAAQMKVVGSNKN